jgi:hypothetical protein
MPRETTYAGIKGAAQRLHVALVANAPDLTHVQVSCAKLGTLLEQIHEVTEQQAAMTAGKQEASKQLKRMLAQAQRLANLLRSAVKENYGSGSEKVVEFGLQPFRGRKAKTEKPVGPESAHPTEPATSPAASTSSPQ